MVAVKKTVPLYLYLYRKIFYFCFDWLKSITVLTKYWIPYAQKKTHESINNRLALVMKSGKFTLGYKTVLRSLRTSKGSFLLCKMALICFFFFWFCCIFPFKHFLLVFWIWVIEFCWLVKCRETDNYLQQLPPTAQVRDWVLRDACQGWSPPLQRK